MFEIEPAGLPVRPECAQNGPPDIEAEVSRGFCNRFTPLFLAFADARKTGLDYVANLFCVEYLGSLNSEARP
jgi:hypothetical protein